MQKKEVSQASKRRLDTTRHAPCVIELLEPVLEHHAEARVPAPQLRRAVGVVGEQEVVHRVRLAAAAPAEVVADERVDAGRVRGGARTPLLGLQHLHGTGS